MGTPSYGGKQVHMGLDVHRDFSLRVLSVPGL